jgi:hypothetical protein
MADYDALIEQLAFGKTTPKLSSCLGLYLSPDRVYISEVTMKGGKPTVERLVPVPLPVQAAKGAVTTLNTDFLNDTLKVSMAIRQVMAQHRWNSKDAIVTLSHHLGLLRYFSMPQIDRRFWTMSVPAEAKKYIPIPMDALSNDFQVGPVPAGADGRPRQGVLFAVSPKKTVPAIQSVMADLDINLHAVELAPCSALRLWGALDASKSEAFCQVHFDSGHVRIIISNKGLPVFFREVYLGPEAPVSESRKVDLGGCLAYAQKQLGVGKISQLRVSGAAGELARWQEVFAQEAGIPATFLDMPAQLGIKSGDWGGYAATGAALRHMTSSPLAIDLVGTGRISELDTRTAKHIFVLGFVASVLILVMGLFTSTMASRKAKELKRYKRDAEVEETFSGKSKDDIEKLIGSMRDQLDTLRAVAGEQSLPTELLKEITEAMPEKLWVTVLNYNSPLKAFHARELMIIGHVVGASTAEEQDAAVAFKDALLKTPHVGKLFPDMKITVRNNPVPTDGNPSQDQLKRLLENRTEFTISGKAAKPAQ